MKKTLKLTALSLALAFTSGLATASDTIAFVDGEYLFAHHPARQVEFDKLNAEFKAPAEKLQESEKQLQAKEAQFRKEIEAKSAALEKDAPRLRQADIKKRSDEIQALAAKRDEEFRKLVEAHQQEVAKFQEEGRQRENEIIQRLSSDIQAVTTKVAEEKKYNAVLDLRSAVYIAPGKDITKDVLGRLSAPAKTEASKAN